MKKNLPAKIFKAHAKGKKAVLRDAKGQALAKRKRLFQAGKGQNPQNEKLEKRFWAKSKGQVHTKGKKAFSWAGKRQNPQKEKEASKHAKGLS